MFWITLFFAFQYINWNVCNITHNPSDAIASHEVWQLGDNFQLEKSHENNLRYTRFLFLLFLRCFRFWNIASAILRFCASQIPNRPIHINTKVH